LAFCSQPTTSSLIENLALRYNLVEKCGAMLDQLAQFRRGTHDDIERKSPVREQVRNGTMPLKHTPSPESIGHDQQINVAVRRRLAIGAGTKQDDCLRGKCSHNLPRDLAQQIICNLLNLASSYLCRHQYSPCR